VSETSETKPLLVSTSPHLRDAETVPRIMWTVAAVLLLPGIYGVFVFGWHALMVILISLASCLATEHVLYLLFGRKTTIGDGSAAVTGLLLAYVLPPGVPWYVPLVGGLVAIGVAKLAFGGLGHNIWNPALAARAFLLASWSVALVGTWSAPRMTVRESQWTRSYRVSETLKTDFAADAVTGATPLNARKKTLKAYNDLVGTYNEEKRQHQADPTGPAPQRPNGIPDRTNARDVLDDLHQRSATPYLDLLLGLRGGCLGETCAILLVLGGLVLMAFRYIDWFVPACFIGTVALLTWMLPVRVAMPMAAEAVPGVALKAARWVAFAGDPLFNILSGGLLLGAFFMATDMVTTPISSKGKAIFAVGCGLFTSVIRLYGGFPEGVAYSILLMNTATPLIDRYTQPKTFGAVQKR